MVQTNHTDILTSKPAKSRLGARCNSSWCACRRARAAAGQDEDSDIEGHEPPASPLIFLRELGYSWQVLNDDDSRGAPETDPAALIARLQASGEHHADLLLTIQG